MVTAGCKPKRGSSFSFDYDKIVIPDWVYDLDPAPMTTAEARAATWLRAAD